MDGVIGLAYLQGAPLLSAAVLTAAARRLHSAMCIAKNNVIQGFQSPRVWRARWWLVNCAAHDGIRYVTQLLLCCNNSRQ